MHHGLQKPRQHSAARPCFSRFLTIVMCMSTVAAALLPFSNAALSETMVVPTSDILMVSADDPNFPLDITYYGWFQTLCLMNGAYPLAVYNTGTRDNIRAALTRDGKNAAFVAGYSHYSLPTGSGYLSPPTAGTVTFTWVDEDNLIPRYGAGKTFYGTNVDAPYSTWGFPPSARMGIAYLSTAYQDLLSGVMASPGFNTVACRKSSSSPLDEDLVSSIVVFDVVRIGTLGGYAGGTFLQCAARDMRLMQPSTAMREFALEAAILRNTSGVKEYVLLGGGYDASSNAWRWNDAWEEPRGAVFTTAQFSSDAGFAERTYANWSPGYPMLNTQSNTNILGLARSRAWQNFQVFPPGSDRSIACEPLDKPFTNKGLYAVPVFTPSSLPLPVVKAYCMLGDAPGEAAQIMNEVEQHELMRVMVRTAISTSIGTAAGPIAHSQWCVMGAVRDPSSGVFRWDSFDLSTRTMSYAPAAIDDPVTTEETLGAAPIQLAWKSVNRQGVTHVMCQPSSVVPSKGNVTLVPYQAAPTRAAASLSASSSFVSAAEADACGAGASPMMVRSAAEQKTLEAALARAYLENRAAPSIPAVDTFVYLNAARRGGAWVWGDGTPVSFAMWDASAADPAGSEGDRLAVQLRERGWHAAAAPTTGTAYVACYAPAPDEEDNTGSGGSGSSGWPWWAYLIIGVGAGVIVLLIILIVVLCCCGCCGACCACGAAQDEEEKNTSEGTAGKSDAAAIPVGTQSSASLQRGSSRRSVPAADSAVAPKTSRRPSDLNRTSQTQQPHSQRVPQQQPSAAAPAANPYMAPPPYAFPPAVPPATGGYAPPAVAPTPQPSAESPQTPAPRNTPQPLPPSRYEPYGVPASFWGSPKPNDSFYGPVASASPQPPAPPNNSPQAVQSPTDEGDGAAPRRRLSRRGSVKFVPPSQNEYAQTPGDLQRVPSARAGKSSDDDVGMEL